MRSNSKLNKPFMFKLNGSKEWKWTVKKSTVQFNPLDRLLWTLSKKRSNRILYPKGFLFDLMITWFNKIANKDTWLQTLNWYFKLIRMNQFENGGLLSKLIKLDKFIISNPSWTITHLTDCQIPNVEPNRPNINAEQTGWKHSRIKGTGCSYQINLKS